MRRWHGVRSNILAATCVVLCLWRCAAETETDRYDGATTDGWLVRSLTGGDVRGAALGVAGGALSLSYERGTLTPLYHNVLLTGLRELRLTVGSDAEATLGIVVKDRDGATFHYFFKSAAGVSSSVTVRPADFQLNDDSPVKKARLDPEALGIGYALIDVGALLGAQGANRLVISKEEVERAAPAVRKGPLVVNVPMTISSSETLDGDLTVTKGGHLKVTAPRFTVRGAILLDQGTLELDGGLFCLPQRFNHEHGVVAVGSGLWRVRHSLVFTGRPFGVALRDGAALEVEASEFRGGMTVDATPQSRVELKGAVSPGELVIAPGARVEIKDTKGVLLWLTLGAGAQGSLELPAGERIADWTSGSGLTVRVSSSEGVLWGILSTPGSDCVVENSRLLAAGLFYGGERKVALSGLNNGMVPPVFDPGADDRKLRFSGTRVAVWNFYAAEQAQLAITNCNFGETLGFQRARIEVRDSACDGSGGYVGGSDDAVLRLTRCRLSCRVIAKDRANLILEDCVVTGALHVAGHATVKLIRTRTEGSIEQDPEAKLVRE